MKKTFKSLVSKAGYILIGTAFLSGCAIMDEETCRATDWYQQGLNDGSKGSSSKLLEKYYSACSEYITVDATKYREGRLEGAVTFCTPLTAYNKGRAGWEVTDICNDLDASVQNQFASYYQRGHNIFEAEQVLKQIDSYISDLREVMSWGTQDVGLLNDYEYFVGLRPTVVSYINKAINAGMDGKYQMYSFDQAITEEVPDKWALDGLSNKVDAISDVSLELERIKNDSCYDSETKACRKRVNCLFDEEDRLNRQLRRYLDSSASSSFYIESYKCR